MKYIKQTSKQKILLKVKGTGRCQSHYDWISHVLIMLKTNRMSHHNTCVNKHTKKRNWNIYFRALSTKLSLVEIINSLDVSLRNKKKV